jgi:hypothetical protein
MKRVIPAGHLAPAELSAKGIDSSLNGVGRQLPTLQKPEHEVDKLPARQVEKSLRFGLRALRW